MNQKSGIVISLFEVAWKLSYVQIFAQYIEIHWFGHNISIITSFPVNEFQKQRELSI